jgi:NADPH:quinone reductase-like Zn-dependent oxidoreductase
MKCLLFEQTGNPADVLKLAERERPQPGNGEVLVRMLASPVNPSDLMFVEGAYGVDPQLPQVPGFEGVGVVESSGGGLRGRLMTGRRVAVLNRSGGNWAEFTVVPADQVIPLSGSLSVEQAATFFVNPATAWVMTQEVLQVSTGEWLLQTAAASSLGRMIIRLGKHLGFRTVNVVRRSSQVDELQRLGADQVVVFDDRSDGPEVLAERVHEATSAQPIRCAVDPVGGATGSGALQALGERGRLLVYGTLSEQPLNFSPRELMTRGAAVEGFWLGRYMQQQGLVKKLLLVRRLTKLIESGVLQTDNCYRIPLEGFPDLLSDRDGDPAAADGHDDQSELAVSRRVHGKVVLEMSATD